MYRFFRSFLFLFPPETAHRLTSILLHYLLKLPFAKAIFIRSFCVKDERLKRTVFGITFDNPIGLAAGFDKNATLCDDFSYCGFGFIEIGTVTPKAQLGNDRPRLFRLKKDRAIINRMGFNNLGVLQVSANLRKRKTSVIIGGNIGKNKDTPNENAKDDYLTAFNTLYPHVDYFVVNVSSPNTPNLRELQEKDKLAHLLSELNKQNNLKNKPKPILVKIAPDLSNAQLDEIIDIVRTTKIHGVIATNTTISRSDLSTSSQAIETIGQGGLSGKPLSKRATEVIRYLSKKSNREFPIIGVGGIDSVADAREKLAAGASLIQLYTGFIYNGVHLIKAINKSLVDHPISEL